MAFLLLIISVKADFLHAIFMSGTSCMGNLEDDFANAKSHYNPNNCPHPFHVGDLPPLIENNGYAYMSFLLNFF